MTKAAPQKMRATGKPKAALSKSHSSMNPDRPVTKGNMRDKATIMRLKMYKSGGKAIRDKHGKVIKAAPFQNSVSSGTVSRIAPNRKWFGNTRVVGQTELSNFREALGDKVNDTYSVLLKSSKIPMSLLTDPVKSSRYHLLDTEKYDNTFGPKAQRKKPKLQFGDISQYAESVSLAGDSYVSEKDKDLVVDNGGVKDETRDKIFQKGQSKRIWGELYKVVDSSDVVLLVVDSRDPMGTRCRQVEAFIKKEKSHKHIVMILNKCDLVPTWVTARWVKVLSAEYPTLAFHASITNPFGKGALIQLLRQYSKLHSDKKQISVGLIGYPNVGKSSIINALQAKKVCNVAPIPGETKVWQYITLMKRIFLIDCPGVVYDNGDTESDIVLKGVVRIENIKDAEVHVEQVLQRVKPQHITRHYGIQKWENCADFLEQYSRKTGKLLKGGEPDINAVARMVLTDWQRGKLPYFTLPEITDESQEPAQEGALSAAGKVPSVAQNFENIRVCPDLILDATDRDSVETSQDDSQKTPQDDLKPAEAIVDWDRVFESVVGEKTILPAEIPENPNQGNNSKSMKRKLPTASSKDGDIESEKVPSKEKRKTTNKQKVGTHYYETANVKNRNLNRRGKKNNNPTLRR
eukprot:Sdes_comp20486_c0_seq1m14871